jgi:hypothetical protein
MSSTGRLDLYFKELGDLQGTLSALKNRRRAEWQAAALSELETQIAGVEARIAELNELIAAAKSPSGAPSPDAETRGRSVDRGVAAWLAHMQRAEQHFAEAARELKAAVDVGKSIGKSIGTVEGRRLFSTEVTRPMARNTCAKHFAIQPTGQLNSANNLLGINSEYVGAKAHLGLAELAAAMTDSGVRIFGTLNGALHARDRLKAAGEEVRIAKLPDSYELVPPDCFFDSAVSASAVAATWTATRMGGPFEAYACEGGFVVTGRRMEG